MIGGFELSRPALDARFELGIEIVELDVRLFKQRGLLFNLLILQKKPGEETNLRFENLRLERLCHVINRAERIAFKNVLLVAARRGNENNRGVLCAFALANQLGKIKAVESGHLKI